jgi:hypothetical protein
MDWRAPCFSRIEKLFGEGGLPRVAAAACCKVISPWIEGGSVEFFSRDFENDIPRFVSNTNLSMRQAGFGDTRLILDVYDGTRSEDKIHGRFRGGDYCFITTDDNGEGVHVNWVSTRLIIVPELNLKLLLRPGEVYNYDAYTRCDMRRSGIDSAARSLSFRHLREIGHHKLYLYVRGENVAGLRAARRLVNSIGKIRYWRSRSGQILYPYYYNQSEISEEFLDQIRTRDQIQADLAAAISNQPAR